MCYNTEAKLWEMTRNLISDSHHTLEDTLAYLQVSYLSCLHFVSGVSVDCEKTMSNATLCDKFDGSHRRICAREKKKREASRFSSDRIAKKGVLFDAMLLVVVILPYQ